MNNTFPYLEIPKVLKAMVGDPDSGTRIYRREGSDVDVGPWYDALCDAFPDDRFVSPGGVGMYASVSRAGVHKRLKEGKLTVFMFHVVEHKRNLFGYQKKLKQLPYGYIPVSECKAWSMELAARPDRRQAEENGDGDFDGKFLHKDPKDKNDKSVKYENETLTAEKVRMLAHIAVEEAISRLLPEKASKKRQQAQTDKAIATITGNRKKRDE